MNYIINEAMGPLREVANILSSEKPVLTDEVARKIANDKRVALHKEKAQTALYDLNDRGQTKVEKPKGEQYG